MDYVTLDDIHKFELNLNRVEHVSEYKYSEDHKINKDKNFKLKIVPSFDFDSFKFDGFKFTIEVKPPFKN